MCSRRILYFQQQALLLFPRRKHFWEIIKDKMLPEASTNSNVPSLQINTSILKMNGSTPFCVAHVFGQIAKP